MNTISPGIIVTPLAKDELSGPRGEGYRRMIGLSAAGRAGTPDEVGNVAALLAPSNSLPGRCTEHGQLTTVAAITAAVTAAASVYV